ncbi:M20 family metallo-hydrolase [Mesorhizobium sp. BAC0120]|uniref:M20 family metallo-hydrolase n=1 Tax=Mesorhizobium sp. BAC0120 TaxID=3090670 RepID=UPI00298C17E6|nr:M20 family metallo-hydrolase [Mesorhizobium sp. BAC0120]MDW6021637.1 M20 family metallo-hydrolase [Mesorhizobium sp. BAC0120]
MNYPANRSPSTISIDAERLWSRHMEMARIGAIDGTGSCRLAMTAEDAEARELLASWCRQAGLDVHVDGAGNMFAVRPGSDPQRLPVASGSHLDTQPHGGRFDGISGVLAALEVIETLNDEGIETAAPLAVVNWTNEEGVRYAPGLLGSAWYAGLLDDEALARVKTADGTPFLQEARERGWLGDSADKFPLGAFVELHIEQGPTLEREGLQVGIVTSVQGLRWLDVEVRGTDAHAGTTPLDQRQDALFASARMLVALNEIGRRYGSAARVSVGQLRTATDGPSTIVGHASFVVDIRHPDADTLEQLTQECVAVCGTTGKASGCEVAVSERITIPPTAFHDTCITALERSAEEQGYSCRRMASGALHDAANVAKVAPTAMIFVPCRDGVSHNVKEYASPEDLAAGTNVLLHAVLKLAR